MFPDKKQIKSEVSPTNIQNPFGSTSLQISTHRPPSKSNGGARVKPERDKEKSVNRKKNLRKKNKEREWKQRLEIEETSKSGAAF